MKKIILTMAAVVFVSVAAQAQSPRVEVAITSAALNNKAGVTTRHTSAQMTRQLNLQNAVARRIAQASVQAQPAKQDSVAKPVTPKGPAKQAEGSVKQWLKAIFLGGRFPNESAQAYHDRLVAQSQPAALPFK